ncbi:zinc finger BED domain-containing protein 5-like [Palaemon carinicauda]|uniref:zinc finger BED domain-containing protein 5-like n=1 Tax=Palaemon carinicauda TaxID=392227 RepID=UPI0035B5E831
MIFGNCGKDGHYARICEEQRAKCTEYNQMGIWVSMEDKCVNTDEPWLSMNDTYNVFGFFLDDVKKSMTKARMRDRRMISSMKESFIKVDKVLDEMDELLREISEILGPDDSELLDKQVHHSLDDGDEQQPVTSWSLKADWWRDEFGRGEHCKTGQLGRALSSTRFDMPKRKYDPAYIKYGFIAIEHGGEALPQCVVCMKFLSNAVMKPSLLKRHLETNHAVKKDQDQSYFQRLGENVKRQRMDKTSQIYQKGAGIVKASYEVTLLVAKNMKAHTIAESLIMPAAKILVSYVIGEEAVAKLENVSVSNNTVQRRIEEMSVDIANQVVEGSNAAKTELLLSQDLTSTTTGKDIFNVLDNFFKQNEQDWGKLVGCTTNGAPSMLGRKSGFQAHVKAVAPNSTAVHCFIHRFAHCAKVLPPKLLSRLNRVIRIVNFVKTSALNTQLFKLLCEDFGSDHICLLYHTEVRRLSRGNMTRGLFELRDVLLVFFKEKEHDFQKDLEDEEFISRLAYRSDIFGALNHLNLSFQGPDCTVTEFISKLGAFVRKLDLWMKTVESKHQILEKYVKIVNGDLIAKVKSDNQGIENVMSIEGLREVTNEKGTLFTSSCSTINHVIGVKRKVRVAKREADLTWGQRLGQSYEENKKKFWKEVKRIGLCMKGIYMLPSSIQYPYFSHERPGGPAQYPYPIENCPSQNMDSSS